MANFKALKYETRTEVEPKEIEDMVIEKMGQWKYSPDQMATQIPGLLLEKFKLRWENSKQTIKDIYAQTLRQLVPSLTNAKVNKALKENMNKMTLKFNTFLILIKEIEYVVKSTMNTWKSIYHLHKLGVEPVEIKDDEDDSDENKEEEEAITEKIQFDNVEIEEGVEEEATKEEKKHDEQTDLVKIVAVVIASLPHSPAKIATSSSKIALASLIVTTPSDTSNVQSSLAHSKINVLVTKVATTSSIEVQPPSSTEL